MNGTLYGIGLGPGDPELISVKAMRLLARPDIVAATFTKAGRKGHAYGILSYWLHDKAHYEALEYPVTTEIAVTDAGYNAALAAFYAEAAERLAACLATGKDVVIGSEGDPLFYGSFMHLYERLKHRFPTRIIPGITGMAGCAAAAGLPMTWGDDVLTVLPATMAETDMILRLQNTDAAVFMKIGRNLPKVRRALELTGKLQRALYIERGTMAGERILPLGEMAGEAPYFAIILVAGEGRRP